MIIKVESNILENLNDSITTALAINKMDKVSSVILQHGSVKLLLNSKSTFQTVVEDYNRKLR